MTKKERFKRETRIKRAKTRKYHDTAINARKPAFEVIVELKGKSGQFMAVVKLCVNADGEPAAAQKAVAQAAINFPQWTGEAMEVKRMVI